MSSIIVFLLFLVLWHFFVEAIFAPNLRMQLRNDLFFIRDCIRRKIILNPNSEDREAFEFLHSITNLYINRLPQITLFTMIRFETNYRRNGEIQNEIDRRLKFIQKFESPEFNKLLKKADLVIKKAFMINMFGWFVWLLPIFFVVFMHNANKVLAKRLKRLVVLPANYIDNILPNNFPESII